MRKIQMSFMKIIDQVKQWIIRNKIGTFLILIYLLPFVIIYKPYKATNPSNPFFFESQFRLSDYNFRSGALADALKILLPVGSSKEHVDKILVQYGGASDYHPDYMPDSYHRYYYKPYYFFLTPEAWWIDVYYDENSKTETIMLNRNIINGNWDVEKYKTLKREKMSDR